MKSYFDKFGDQLVVRTVQADIPGLRRSQVGAIHAISSHFTVHDSTPALIVMPTGTGKTAVITMAPFFLSAKRVLVVTSSKLVRGQIADEFRKLKTLTSLKVFMGDQFPLVFERKKKIDKSEIKVVRKADVIIGIPNAILTLLDDELDVKDDFFDLILIDEAHHRAASTWANIVDRFPKAKKVLFTATPFRRDKRPLQAKIIYNYPLSMAKADGSFAEIEFHSASPGAKETVDEAIAKKAAEIFNKDRKAGLKHYLMVRTKKLSHASELLDLYKAKTNLNLALVSSKITFRAATATINKLKSGEIDGVVCVDMLGEGFDFPNLKIAAVHVPHKSEAITLQFIGRFTRTNAGDIGNAKFIATPNDLQIGKHRLFVEGAAWKDLIIDLSESSVADEVAEQEIIETFSDLSPGQSESDVTLFSLTPFSHVKIYQVNEVDLTRDIDFGPEKIVRKFFSEEYSYLVVVTVNETKPKWISSPAIADRQYSLYVVYYDKVKKLLFINSTAKSEDVYQNIFECLIGSDEERAFNYQIEKERVHKVLLNIEDPAFFGIGMLNRNPGSGESYKTLTGSQTQNRVSKTDGVLYENGHVYCGGTEDGVKTTLGYSSASKVWSNSYKSIGEFLTWCNLIGSKILSPKDVKTNTGLDNLPIGRKVENLPEDIVYAYWGPSVYQDFPKLEIDGDTIELADLDLEIGTCDQAHLFLNIVDDGSLKIPLKFSLKDRFSVEGGGRYVLSDGRNLTDYLNEEGVVFQTKQLHTLVGNTLTEWKFERIFNTSQLIAIDWVELGADITIEFGTRNSIQEILEEYLKENVKPEILICDHGTGEAADYIAVKQTKHSVDIAFYHVKKSGTPIPGERSDDLYEVVGQVMKATGFTTGRSTLVKKLSSRLANKASKFKIGNFNDLAGLTSGQKPLRLKMVIVQPGLSKSKVTDKAQSIIAGPDHFLRALGVFEPLEVMCSP